MKNVVFVSLCFLFLACVNAHEREAVVTEEIPMLPPEMSTTLKTVEAKVIYEPFVNKAGKLIEGAGDYFLVYDNQNWFIKFSSGKVLREDVARLKDQTATFSLAEREGLWDTDDPNVQSRVGKYVVLYEIVK